MCTLHIYGIFKLPRMSRMLSILNTVSLTNYFLSTEYTQNVEHAQYVKMPCFSFYAQSECRDATTIKASHSGHGRGGGPPH